MPRPDYAEMLVSKAAQDEYVLDLLLDDPRAPEEVYGFHAQQAAEKLLMALLAAAQVEFPFTHRLEELLDLAQEAGVDLPESSASLRYLTPFAVEFRYGALPDEPEQALDRRAVRQWIVDLRACVAGRGHGTRRER